MKNKIIILVVLICTTMAATAQQSQKFTNPKWVKNQKIFGQIIKATNTAQHNKTRAADERLIADVYEETTTDSSLYTYSGSRGSQIDKTLAIYIDNNDYDRMTYYSTTMPAVLDSRSNRTYNSNSQVLVQLDSTYNGTTWDANVRITNTYNTSSQLSSSLNEWWTGTAWANSFKTDYTYTGNKQEELSKTWNGTSWDNSYKINKVFTGNNLTELIDSNWNGTMWEGLSKKTFTYYPNNQMETEITQINNVSVWENYEKLIYTFYPTNKIEKYLQQTWNNNQWEDEAKVDVTWVGTTSATGLVALWNGTSWIKESRNSVTFNALAYPTMETIETWDGTAYVYDPSSGDYKERYYYEAYNNNVGVQNIASSVFGIVTIFPNPSNDMVTIEISKASNTNKEVTLMDMMGKVIIKSGMEKSSQTTSINLSGLTAGNYMVQIKDASGYNFTSKIVKQ